MVWASPELSGRQLARLVADSPLPVGVLVHGRIELMVTEHCVLQAIGACARACASCGRRHAGWRLRDRKGYLFPVMSDPAGRTHVYNSVPLDLSRAMDEVVATGAAAIRLELHLEEPREAARLVSAYRAIVAAAVSGRPMPSAPIGTPSTSGHFFRGVG
jgi:putative protease